MLQKNPSQGDMTKISQVIFEDGAKKKSKHILITGLCNNNCMFCFSKGILKKQHKPLQQIKKELKEGIKEGCEKLVLSGGEPTIHPNFLEILEEGKKADYKSISTITNGRMFSYQGFLDRAIAKGSEYGYRNAQATVIAPTGTISFLMGCDTTGIEPATAWGLR